MAVRTPGVDVRAVVQAQRTATVRALQDYTRAREAAADELSWLLVADSLIFAAEAESAGSTTARPAWRGSAHPNPSSHRPTATHRPRRRRR